MSRSSLTLAVPASQPGFAELSLTHPEGLLPVPNPPRLPALGVGPAQLGQTLAGPSLTNREIRSLLAP